MPISYGMEYVSGNFYTNNEQKRINAKYAYYFLQRVVRGWTVEAIAAMCGNWQSESGINPGIWEGLDEGDELGGYGLVQWTPATKLLDWARAEGLDPGDMATNLLRIEYELQNDLQWESGYYYPMTFNEFKHSHWSPFYLAAAFCLNYEHPSDPDLRLRGSQANEWYAYFQTLPRAVRGGKLWMYYAPRWATQKRS